MVLGGFSWFSLVACFIANRNYCCVPGCKSAFYDKSRENTNISLFTIPKREDLRKK